MAIISYFVNAFLQMQIQDQRSTHHANWYHLWAKSFFSQLGRACGDFVASYQKALPALLSTLSHTYITRLRLVGYGCLRVDIRTDHTFEQGATNNIILSDVEEMKSVSAQINVKNKTLKWSYLSYKVGENPGTHSNAIVIMGYG